MMSFSRLAVQRMGVIAPDVPTVFLMDKIPSRYLTGALPGSSSVAGISIASLALHPEFVETMHSRGGQVHVWTVNEPSQVELCLSLGVDAIISDKPAMVRSLVE